MVEEIRELRGTLKKAIGKAIYKDYAFSVLRRAELDPVLSFLKQTSGRRFRLVNISGRRSKPSSQKDRESVFLKNLPSDTTQFMLRSLFQHFEIEDIRIPQEGGGKGGGKGGKGGGRGFAFVQFVSRDKAREAVEAIQREGGVVMGGRSLVVKLQVEDEFHNQS